MKEMTTVQKKEEETSCNIHDYWLIFHGTGPVLGLLGKDHMTYCAEEPRLFFIT